MKLYQTLIDYKTNIDWKYVCSIIKQLPTEVNEVLYALILHHYKLDNNEVSIKPYGIRSLGKKGILVQIDTLPDKLKDIIRAFIDLYVKSRC